MERCVRLPAPPFCPWGLAVLLVPSLQSVLHHPVWLMLSSHPAWDTRVTFPTQGPTCLKMEAETLPHCRLAARPYLPGQPCPDTVAQRGPGASGCPPLPPSGKVSFALCPHARLSRSRVSCLSPVSGEALALLPCPSHPPRPVGNMLGGV